VISADLASPTAAADLHAAVQQRGISVTSLINNAGFGTFGPFADDDLARLNDEIAVDITAPVSLSHVFLPALSKHGNGFLINVASMAAYAPAPEWLFTPLPRRLCSASEPVAFSVLAERDSYGL